MTSYMYYVRRIALLAELMFNSTHKDREFTEYAYHELVKDIDKSHEMGNLTYYQHGNLIAKMERELL